MTKNRAGPCFEKDKTETGPTLDMIQTDMDWYGFDEAMINCNLYSMESRMNSYRLLADKAIRY